MTNHVDRLYAAITVLAGHGHIKQRLIKAYEEHLDDIDEEELPISIQQSFADFRRSMHRVAPLRGETAVCASVRKMSPDDATACATHVVAFYRELARRPGNSAVTIPIGDADTPRVPPFLIKSV